MVSPYLEPLNSKIGLSEKQITPSYGHFSRCKNIPIYYITHLWYNTPHQYPLVECLPHQELSSGSPMHASGDALLCLLVGNLGKSEGKR